MLAAMAALLLPGTGAAEAARTAFPEPVQAMLAKHGVPGDSLSVYVQDVTAAIPLLTVNAQIPRNPASVMKLVTTLVALSQLGPAFRFHTDVYADTKPVAGRVDGNVYLRGGGDPFLVTESFWRLLKDLRDHGVQHITGDLVVDSSYFDVPEIYWGDFDGRPTRAYNVGPDATLVNFFATRFKFFPDPGAGEVRIVVDPALPNLSLDNRIRLVKGRCSGSRRKVQVSVTAGGSRPTASFTGALSQECSQYQLLRSVMQPLPFTFGTFSAMWNEMGGRIDGTGRRGRRPSKADLIQRSPSRPLAELIRFMNKYSNNVMTRNLLLALGARTYGPPGTLEKGRKAIAEWLLLHDISAPELFVDNGSGLSRKARVSALSLARMLVTTWNSPFMPEFISSLPLSAMDGTLRKRFKDSEMEGRVHMKTGLLNGVRSIAGYLQTRGGRRLVLVSLQNHPGIQNKIGTELQDVLITWAFEQW
jgi:D-alanyl-D-alanine carboxypeptidase/D-alanyl-D-alanine-endopeptidase (penicillin-binding protein 4)